MRVPDHATWRRYLRSRAWAARRLKAIEKAGYRCQVCRRLVLDASKLDVHHLDYSRLGHERDEDVAVLCSRCHRRTSR